MKLNCPLAPLLAIAVTLTSAAQAAFRSPCVGLMHRDFAANYVPNEPGKTHQPVNTPIPAFMDSVVVMVNWSDLESSDGVWNDTTNDGWQKIAAAVTALKNGYTDSNGTVQAGRGSNAKVRLRIMAGRRSPVWLKTLVGSVTITEPWDNVTDTVPKWWTAAYQAQYQQLINQIKSRYDTNGTYSNKEVIREVVISGAMTVYAEPFIRVHNDVNSSSNQDLYNGGLRGPLSVSILPAGQDADTFYDGGQTLSDWDAHKTFISAHAGLTAIRSSIAISPWDCVVNSPSTNYYQKGFPPVYELMQWAQSGSGIGLDALVLQNNSLGATSDYNPTYDPRLKHFKYIADYAGHKGFQTRTLANLGSLPWQQREALEDGLGLGDEMGARYVELPTEIESIVGNNYSQQLSSSGMTLADWDAIIRAN